MLFFRYEGAVVLTRWPFGFGPGVPTGQKIVPRPLPAEAKDLARIGIPARKIPRVLGELQRAADADVRLERRVTLLRLARAIAALLP